MKITDLNKIDVKDLQNLDYQKIFEDLRKRPDIILSIAAVVVTLFFPFSYYQKKKAQIRQLQYQIQQMEDKKEIIDKYEKSKQELDKLINNLPENVDEDLLIKTITETAVTRNIQIISYSPSRKIEKELYDIFGITLNVTAKQYQDMWLFIHDIEKSKYALRVDNLRAYPDRNIQRANRGVGNNKTATQPEDTTSIEFSIEIALINFKSEDKKDEKNKN